MVDTATKYVWIKSLVNLDGQATMEAKDEYEAYCLDYGVVNEEYLTDLGTPFTSEAFTSHLIESNSKICRNSSTSSEWYS